MNGPLRDALAAAGARFFDQDDRQVVHDFGDPAAEYEAIRSHAGLVHRGDLARFRMWGRDPVKMLQGLITNELAGAPQGQGVYATMLTPKGRTIAELRAFRLQRAEGAELLIDFPAEAAAGVAAHLKKFVPPLFARWQDDSESSDCIGVYGPGAARIVAERLAVDPPGPAEDAYIEVEWQGERVLVVHTLYVGGEPGFDLIAPRTVATELWKALAADSGTRHSGYAALDTLRIEAGRPRYGRELTEETIPTEAFQESGLLERAISFTKGCYTGQEVIVRIAHRGHVNRHLRGLLLRDRPVPPLGATIVDPGSGREVGRVTSAARSPRLGQTIALGYVRREIGPGGTVLVGGPDGDSATVVRLPFGADKVTDA